MSKEYIASVLKRLRTSSGLTADEVGKKVGKSGKTVNGWENARSQPDAEILLQLCDIYKVKDILSEFSELTNKVINNVLPLSNHEEKVITAYRQHPEHQYTIDTILNIEQEHTISSLSAARSKNNDEPIHIVDIPDLSKIKPDDTTL